MEADRVSRQGMLCQQHQEHVTIQNPLPYWFHLSTKAKPNIFYVIDFVPIYFLLSRSQTALLTEYSTIGAEFIK